jgi:hypothetical protein
MTRKSQNTAVVGRSRVSCIVENSVLGALVQVLTDHRVCQMRVDPYEEPTSLVVEGRMSPEVERSLESMKGFSRFVTTEPPRRKKQTGGARPTSETRMGRQLLLILNDHSGPPMTSGQIGGVLEKYGFNKASASSSLTRLVREGLVIRDETDRNRPTYSLGDGGRGLLASHR